ncbi:MAG: transglutaminase family protein [Paracoccaceae bacterium]|nr:transglutaminase family protein [Paracoccaceae bacterium]
MKLSIRHTSRYVFDAPVRGVVQNQRLFPALCGSQRVLQWSVNTPGATKGACFRDSAGDWVETVSIRGPVKTVEVQVTGEVETTDTAGVLRDHAEQVVPSVYLRSTRQTAADAALQALTHEALEPAGTQPLARAHALAGAVAEAIAYKPGETEAHTTAAEALSGGIGVCQDHAHALIACAHVADIPARYVTGYLQADADGQVHEASHAWAELFVEDLGWVGFDPANQCCPDERYVRLGSGYDAQDAAPIRGLVQGGTPAEHLEVEVTVSRHQQQQQ